MNFASVERLGKAVEGTAEGNVFTSGKGGPEASVSLEVAGIDVGFIVLVVSNTCAASVPIEVAVFTVLAVGSLTSLVSQPMNNETIMMVANIVTDIFFAKRKFQYPFNREN